MVSKASSQLLAIAEEREPTEQEAQELTLRLVDEEGACGHIDLTPSIVTALKAKGLIRYCGHCTRKTILWCAGDDDGGYTAAEYHLEVHDYEDFFSDAHTYRCIVESGVLVPGIEEMLDEEDKLCDVCNAANAVWKRAMTSNATKVKAYQMIRPVGGLGMRGFAERLLNRPAWQEVLVLIEQGRVEEAEAKAAEIRDKRENN